MFINFKTAIQNQFDRMKSHELFRVQVDKDLLWETYLKSFPEGTNPIYKEQTEHDCNCCKSFIRSVGNMIAIIDGKIESIWDIKIDNFYQAVADSLSELIKSKPIDNIFLHYEPEAGVDKNHQLIDEKIITWNHLYIQIPNKFVTQNINIGTKLSQFRAIHDVMIRGLKEITIDSIETVLELINQNSLYRGEEHKFAVESFLARKKIFDKLKSKKEQDIFCWSQVKKVSKPIRNTVIGSLLVDLTEGIDLEEAVKSFDSKVAPTNYKRPTALVTNAMIKKAQEKIEELGFTSALNRRSATIEDITINNILFANRESKKKMNVFDEISAEVPEKIKNFNKVEEIGIEKFIKDILPQAKSLEIMFENKHTNNLVTLIAPNDPESKGMFKWPNNFSWTYRGETADSIKERVKKAGGNVTGDICCRLSWNNRDDLDFHMYEPRNYQIHFRNKRIISPCGGVLDVDANGGDGIRQDPCENIVYKKMSDMKEGIYTLVVHQYHCRETDNIGFDIEIDIQGTIHHFSYPNFMKTGSSITIAKIHYSKKDGIKVEPVLESSNAIQKVWNISTQKFHNVNVMMYSPNYWNDKCMGNKHYFFMLNDCLNDSPVRGFFNEFLTEELNENRKVLEIVGSKMKTSVSDNQLSGLGFSSTQRNSVLCRVKGNFTRIIKIIF